ncbi:DUF6283 family protein [Mycobacteroides abscessus]|uniref:DUF6283 family protein n=1 Tax=Mycobacteroides abscessus TaxID=36809 RepID=UPI001F3B8D44|nr:DUF6283 family protein [Mycobacteroides abscessus]
MEELPRCVRPCANCPWRTDSAKGEFSTQRFEALRATVGVPGREVGLGAPMFACHKSEPGRDRACAGWLAVAGVEHLGIRLAVALGRLPAAALRPGDDWPDLFGSYDEMVERNGLPGPGVRRGDSLSRQSSRGSSTRHSELDSRPSRPDSPELIPPTSTRS